MPQHWDQKRSQLLTASSALGLHDRTAVRIADLLLSRAIAENLKLVEDSLQASRLVECLEQVSLFTLPKLSASRTKRNAAVAAALSCAEQISADGAWGLWSESSQAGDPGRKGRGAFSTPPVLGTVMAREAITTFGMRSKELPKTLDPSAGHGALLLAVLDELLSHKVPIGKAINSLYGVELDPNARELCCLMLWLKAGRKSVKLCDIASRIITGNALTGQWQAEQQALALSDADTGLHPGYEFTWDGAFADVFAGGGFDLVIANPPWESLRHCHAADEHDWVQRQATRDRLASQRNTGRGLPPLYSAQGRGDRNLYKGFVELFPHLLAPKGQLVALLPGAFSSDFGMQAIREFYLENMELERWTGFENLAGYFPIDGRYKFGILVAKRSKKGTSTVNVRFMARYAEDASHGHLQLNRNQLATLGGPSRMLPEITNSDELSILECATGTGTAFFDPDGSFGSVTYQREVDLTIDRKAGRFVHLVASRRDGFEPCGNGQWTNGSKVLVPLIEGRMISSWDFFEKSWISGRGRSARWKVNEGSLFDDVGLSTCQPQFLAPPLDASGCRIAICDVTSATNTRTMRACWVPPWPCGNTAPVISAGDTRRTLALLAVLNSMTFDWLLRRLAAGLHLNRFYLEAISLPCIADDELKDLATFAATKMLAGRCKDLAEDDIRDLKLCTTDGPGPSAGEVEAIVARGYGFQAKQVRRVMDASQKDRKGLWRYYAAVPDAELVAQESIRLLEAA